MELRHYAMILWRWTWLIVLSAVLAGGAAYFVSQAQTPIYQATTSILIDQAPDARNTEFTALLLAERLTDTYGELIVKRPVLEEVIQELGIDLEPEVFAAAIEVTPVRETQIINIKVENQSPTLAAKLANTLVSVFSDQNANMQSNRFAASKTSLEEQLSKLEEQIQGIEGEVDELGVPSNPSEETNLESLHAELAQYQNSYTLLLQSYEALRLQEALSVSNIVQIEVAEPGTTPIRPRTLMNTVLATVVGGMLAVGVVFLIEYLDDTIKTTEDASSVLDLPVIGFITRIEHGSNSVPFVIKQPRSPVTESFRSLRSNIQFADVDKPIHSILVTSPTPEEGKSTVAANLSIVMAQNGKSVLLLDADMRKPRLHKILDLPNSQGLSDFFVKRSGNLRNFVHQFEKDNFSVITSGRLPPNPAELLGSERMSQLIEMLKRKFDVIVVDSPPIGVVTDPVILSTLIDATILVVEPEKTQTRAALHSIEQLRRADAKVIGLVFNNVPPKRVGHYSGYRNGYYYKYSEYHQSSENGREVASEKERNKFGIRGKRVK
ncbi:MAG: polysaccharide biosynthesis tyrosine autokinase [Candidatus Hermodarchaeia archaeon]|jgi:non-specific protein-tyrosine kinase